MAKLWWQGLLALSSSASAFIAPCQQRVAGSLPLARAGVPSWSTNAAAAAAASSPPSRLLLLRPLTVRAATASPSSPPEPTATQEKPWKINLLYDSDCPLCMKEVDFLRKRDVENNILFTDLNAPDYKPEEHGGVDFASGMKVIHAVLPDGSTVKGVEVFRRVYDAIGLGWVYAVTKLPVVGDVADWAYDLWAVNRLKITGRPELEEILKERQEKIKNTSYDDCSDECEIKW